MHKKFHLQDHPIPEGFQIFETVDVAGVYYRLAAATAFATSKNQWIELEREKRNKHDANAIKVIGCSKGWFFIKRRFIGYIPRDTAKRIVEGGYWGLVKPRLRKTIVGDDPSDVAIGIQILGPKAERAGYYPTFAKGKR